MLYLSPVKRNRLFKVVGLWLVMLMLFSALPQAVFAQALEAQAPQDADLTTDANDHMGVWLLYPNQSSEAQPMYGAGARWTRVIVDWKSVEKTPGVYTWGGADTLIRAAQNQAFSVIVSVMTNPDWAADTSCGPIKSQHLVTYANFMRALVNRYSRSPYNIHIFETGNEPDNADAGHGAWVGGCWGRGLPTSAAGAGGAAYANMLSQIYPAMKAANSSIQVAIGGLAYDGWFDEGGTFDPVFVDELLQAGGGSYFDIINYHYYNGFAYKWGNIVGKGRALQSKVRQYAGRNKPLMASEFGKASGTGTGYNAAAEQVQADYVIQGFTQGAAAGISPMIWFWAVDRPNLAGGFQYGLMRGDYARKPAYHAYNALATELTGATFSQQLSNIGDRIEAYLFGKGGGQLTILWRNGSGTTPVSFSVGSAGGTLRVVDKVGNVSNTVDGSGQDLDGARNGQVRIAVGSSPLMVGANVSSSPAPTATSTPLAPTITPTPSAPTATPTQTPPPPPGSTATFTPTPTSTPRADVTSTATPTPGGTRTPTPDPNPIRFRGITYKGEEGDKSQVLDPVIIHLYGRNGGDPEPGMLLQSAITSAGFYNMQQWQDYEYFRLIAQPIESMEVKGVDSADGQVLEDASVEWHQPGHFIHISDFFVDYVDPSAPTPTPAITPTPDANDLRFRGYVFQGDGENYTGLHGVTLRLYVRYDGHETPGALVKTTQTDRGFYNFLWSGNEDTYRVELVPPPGLIVMDVETEGGAVVEGNVIEWYRPPHRIYLSDFYLNDAPTERSDFFNYIPLILR